MAHRSFAIIVLFIVLNACASSGPARTGGYALDLRLCAKPHISNAPAADRSGRIVGYEPYKTVRGVTLARAPVPSCLSSGFGARKGGAGRVHKGIDLYTGERRAIAAAAAGRVVEIGEQRGFGRTIVIRHRNGVATRYAHLSSFASGMRKGARVNSGAVIGRTGKTGNASAVHLHYEILVDGAAINPLW